MTLTHVTFTLPDDATLCSSDELAGVSGLTNDEVTLLVEAGVLVPADAVADTLVFHLHYLVVANTARRLRDDFELEGHGLALALTLLRRIREAETELAALRAQFARPLPAT